MAKRAREQAVKEKRERKPSGKRPPLQHASPATLHRRTSSTASRV